MVLVEDAELPCYPALVLVTYLSTYSKYIVAQISLLGVLAWDAELSSDMRV